ncbi:MAG: hypothetical protein FWD33_00280 [Alphaproteobacteria bacterium]|nr:hypothetical protein [Alphaproteobacteria bacterium]
MSHGRVLFGIMAFALVAVIFASVILQALNNQTEKSVRSLNAASVRLDRGIADARSEFSRLIRTEVLKSAQVEMFPKFEVIRFNNRITVAEIPEVK